MSKVFVFKIASLLAVQLIAAEPVIKKPTDEQVRRLGHRDVNHTYLEVVVDLAFGGNGTTRVTFSKLSSSDSQGRVIPAQGTLVWEYREARPVPLVKGMEVSVTIEKAGRISKVWTDVQVIAYRKKDAGELELIVKSWGAPYMYLRPHWIGTLGGIASVPAEFFTERSGTRSHRGARGAYQNAAVPVTLCWSDKYGIMLTVFEAGPGVTESEPAISRTNTVPVGNSPSFKFSPGREGWKLLTPENQGVTIPDAQKIWCAG
jgi:hypothetical protein